MGKGAVRRAALSGFLLSLGKVLGQELRQHLDAGGARAAGRRHQMHRAFRLLPALEDHFDLAGWWNIAISATPMSTG